MRTVDKLLKLNLNRKKRRFLTRKGIINWCWGKWGIDFDDVFDYVVSKYPKFNTDKAKTLYADFKNLCWEHDIKYWEWNTKIKRILADFRLAYSFFKLLHWTTLWKRIWFFLLVFVWLLKNGHKYYNYDEKKCIDEFLSCNFTDTWTQQFGQ